MPIGLSTSCSLYKRSLTCGPAPLMARQAVKVKAKVKVRQLSV